MLDVIYKDEYFASLTSGLADRSNYSLKGIQDAWILSQLSEIRGTTIIEVGGGNSRVLPHLSGNKLYNMDKFGGVGNGPKQSHNADYITCIPAFIGDFASDIPQADVIFSISVVEHIPFAGYGAFFSDIYRLLVKGGVTLHAVDIPLHDEPLDIADRRISALLDSVIAAGLRFRTTPKVSPGLTFSCAMASNSDLTQWEWMRFSEAARVSVPAVQIVSLKLIAERP